MLVAEAETDTYAGEGYGVAWLRPGETFRDLEDTDTQLPQMVVVPAGSFVMGRADVDSDADTRDELPAHQVTIPTPFAVGKFPITFDEWDDFPSSGQQINDEGWGAGSRPIIKISWDRAQKYVEWLSELTGHTYRLLSEAEWEYCCRAGTDTEFSMGDTIRQSQACFDADKTKPVGTFPPNSFGLYDMHGNVWEWCEDFWHDDYRGAPSDAASWLANGDELRVLRGGSWINSAPELRSRYRMNANATARDKLTGFRVARDLGD